MRMPALFVGHGNPMFAIQTNAFTEAWAALGRELPRPRALLVLSAHWYVPGLRVTAMAAPRTIHDFGGFPEALFRVEYPAAGDPALAERVRELLAPLPIESCGRRRPGAPADPANAPAEDPDAAWGLDHGTWSVLRHVYPAADIPVVQLSLDRRQSAAFHHDLGKRLAPLREEGVLIVGSGNLVHNLARYAWSGDAVPPFEWGVRFETRVRELLRKGEDGPLIDYAAMGPDALLSVPTPDHYLPLLPILGLRRPDDPVSFPVEGFDGGSMSMLAVRIG